MPSSTFEVTLTGGSRNAFIAIEGTPIDLAFANGGLSGSSRVTHRIYVDIDMMFTGPRHADHTLTIVNRTSGATLFAGTTKTNSKGLGAFSEIKEVL